LQFVDVKVHGKVATILMDRPDVRNALNPQLIEDLSTAFSDVHQEKRVRAVVLSGNGEHFCAGLDLRILSEISQMSDIDALPQWHTVWQNLTRLLEEMLRFPKPVIAAVDGAALGAGLALVLACDLAVASSRATFGSIAIRRGLVGGATAALLNFRLGGAIASRMLLTGAPIDAGEAYRIGLCGEPVASDQIWVAASNLATETTHAPSEAVQATKRLLNEGIGETLLTQLSAGAADSATACSTESAGEGVQSFLEKREPKWP